VYAGSRSAAIFRGKLCVAILWLTVGITPTGNREAGKFAPDATELPTGCQPESLAKPARRRSHKATPAHCGWPYFEHADRLAFQHKAQIGRGIMMFQNSIGPFSCHTSIGS
jgi:hypothetical protein